VVALSLDGLRRPAAAHGAAAFGVRVLSELGRHKLFHSVLFPRNTGCCDTLTAITGSGSAQAPVAERPVVLPPVTRERAMTDTPLFIAAITGTHGPRS
jgi:hypothetical protein